jgi:hypothetical protein
MRECLFCGSSELTQEHLWSKWVNDCIPPVEFTVRASVRNGSPKEWPRKRIEETVGAACGRCNNGFMSRLDSEAKSVLCGMMRYGAKVSLLPTGIKAVARYAFKMAVVATVTGEMKDKPYFCAVDRHRFAKTLEIPPGIQIWLFSPFSPGSVNGTFNSHYRGLNPEDVKHPFELYVATFAMNFVGIQIIASRWSNPHFSAINVGFPGVTESDKWDGMTVPLWPNGGKPLVWPPEKFIYIDKVTEFSNRWDTFYLPTWEVKSHDRR